jgi:exopolysaccharide biosynthesis predicted pyruvyltransferase EpsI
MTSLEVMRANAFIDQTNVQIQGLLRTLVAPGTKCALLDVPTTANWGDNAIWVGERRCLLQAGMRIVYESDDLLFSPHALERRLDDGIIVLHGGGSVGDIYPTRQSFREMILTRFPNRRIIQLPQSIFFREKQNLDRAKQVFEGHRDFTLLVRDSMSLAAAKAHFDVDLRLSPDFAFGIGPLARVGDPDYDLLWLDRKGPEAVERSAVDLPPNSLRSDWSLPTRRTLGTFRLLTPVVIDRALRRIEAKAPRAGSAIRPCRKALLSRIGPSRLRLATSFLSQARVVITDRLHGHIVSVLLGIPSVLLDNRIGKLRAYYDTWTSQVDIAHLADDQESALRIALGLANRA